MTDRMLERRWMDSGRWKNDGEVRRGWRLLLREWAVNGRDDYGRNSIKGYIVYYPNMIKTAGGDW